MKRVYDEVSRLPIMEKFVIYGGKPLSGKIDVLGSKNAATPLIAASILFTKPVTLTNIPLVEDVFRMLDILASMNATITWPSKRSVCIDTQHLTPETIDQEIVKMLRSSILFVGPLLARFKKCMLIHPGGCMIGARPLDTHFQAFQDLGVVIRPKKRKGCDMYSFDATGLHGGEVTLEEFSVTATENVLMLASLLVQPVWVNLVAREPHVQDLIRFLRSAGVSISEGIDNRLQIKGKRTLRAPKPHQVVSDYIEAGTFLVLSALSDGAVSIKNVPEQFLATPLKKLTDAGITVSRKGTGLSAKPKSATQGIRLQTFPYPGFPTDLQAPFGLLATQLQGASYIQETMFENRFSYLKELKRMGGNVVVRNVHEAQIKGKTPLKGASIESFDLRAGITLILAGLIAKGETIIHNTYQVDRGYERIDERLRKLGADIKRISLHPRTRNS
jgi:UDP-N-acetylglucosamine 1-carboxyvinyltransferase